ncbi:glycosyltransferase involved in cell wall biosynthesis [Filimonas zeae]|uniref:Glycosyl transferase n=1 Tax=Filimonas zeae TaxID=1737353 RepID=A0A917IMW9_9BACT|nr:glycosyltransferase [Filimonas zeae]MDR6337159.1 glycosyltransferase involved in cell wall biosynthesis [Filimonas zeae]GGH57272.1 glycosyl transferase [Filimonas zeae]
MPAKISVVIPTYQRPHLLEKCLLALSQQSFPPDQFEVLVVTDGPDDESFATVRRFQQLGHTYMYVTALPEKKGPAAARNKGWRMAQGDLIVFTDDDCIPHRDFVAAYHQARLATYKKYIAFSGKVIVPVSKHPTDYEQNTAHLATADFITANCACTRAALEDVGGFDEAFTAAWREDSDLEFKFLHANIPIYKIDTAIVEHPVRAAHWGVSLKEQRKSVYNALLYKKFPDMYRRRIAQGPQWRYYAIIVCFLLTLISAFYGAYTSTLLALAGWAWLTGAFAYKRLSGKSRSLSHVSEMIYTSALIPFLSVFWTLYGAIRYKVLFL